MCERVRRNGDDAYNSENSDTRFAWLVLPILVGCLFGLLPHREYRKRRSAYLIGSLTIWALFYGLARIAHRRKMDADEAYEGFLHSAYRFDNPVDGRYNLQMEYTGIDPDQKQANLFITVIAALLVIVVAADLQRTGRRSIRWSRS